MRNLASGLLLASVLLISACSGPETPAESEAPVAFSIPLKPNTNGVLEARSAQVLVGTGEKTYAAQVAMTPAWWVTGEGFKVVWFAGKSQTKRYFQITGGSPGDVTPPAVLRAPEEGVREVRVSFDGGPPVAVRPEATRAVFQPPEGAKAVTSIEIAFGPKDRPVPYIWR
jgi:hypothetical protein